MATRAEYIDKIMAKMDELTSFSEGVIISSGNDGVLPIGEYIESILDECTREHLYLCPLIKIASGQQKSVTTGILDTTKIAVAKPADYIKLISFFHATLKRPITVVTEPGDPKYNLQFNDYVKGNVNKPVLINTGTDFVCYSITGSSTTIALKYVGFTLPESITDTLTIDLICSLTASKVLAIMGETEKAKLMDELYQRLMNA